MADKKISSFDSLTAVAQDDEMVIVDKSDTTMGSTGTTKKVTTAELLQDVTHGATDKTTPVDADEVGLVDSAASYIIKKLSFLNLKYAIGSWLNPVGTIREFNVSTNPATLLGFGTWSAYGAGRVTVCIDSGQTEFDTVGETGGAKTHTLTSSESGMISHTHAMNIKQSGTESSGYGLKTPADGFTNRAFVDGTVNSTSAAGPANASSPHNNLQPYIVVYRWVRVS